MNELPNEYDGLGDEDAEIPPKPSGPPVAEIWIAPGFATKKGKGTAANPYRVSSPQEFDEVFRKVHTQSDNPAPTVFRLMPGDYFTQGCWAHPKYATLWAGDALLGTTGVVVKLAEPVMETQGRKRPDIHVLSAGSPFTAGNNCRVENLLIDGGANLDTVAKGLYVTSGLRIYGVHNLIHRVEVQDVCGSYSPVQTPSGKIPLEAFGISFEAGYGNRVRDCRVIITMQGNTYVSAFSAASARFDGVVFENCHADGQGQHAAFTCYDSTIVKSCSAYGFSYGIYNDTGSATRVLIDGGEFSVARVGIGLVGVAPGSAKAMILARDVRFDFKDSAHPVGLELIAKPEWDGVFQDIEMRGCRFGGTDKNVFTLISTDANAAQLLLVRAKDCIGPRGMRCNLPEGHRIELLGNMTWGGEYFERRTGARQTYDIPGTKRYEWAG
jgi:hypothetical protein